MYAIERLYHHPRSVYILSMMYLYCRGTIPPSSVCLHTVLSMMYTIELPYPHLRSVYITKCLWCILQRDYTPVLGLSTNCQWCILYVEGLHLHIQSVYILFLSTVHIYLHMMSVAQPDIVNVENDWAKPCLTALHLSHQGGKLGENLRSKTVLFRTETWQF